MKRWKAGGQTYRREQDLEGSPEKKDGRMDLAIWHETKRREIEYRYRNALSPDESRKCEQELKDLDYFVNRIRNAGLFDDYSDCQKYVPFGGNF